MAMTMITTMPMAMNLPLPRRGCGGARGAAVGIEPGTSGVGGRSLGEKSRGTNLRADGFCAECTGAGTGNACGGCEVSGRVVGTGTGLSGWGSTCCGITGGDV